MGWTVASSNSHITFGVGGTLTINGTLNAATISANTIRISQGQKPLASGGIVKSPILKYYQTPKRCWKRKGGPRSKTFCEVFEEVPHTTHIGRSYYGRWYSWKDEE